jgi:uncharacterized oxidoreductase
MATPDPTIASDDLAEALAALLVRAGTDPAIARAVADNLVEAEMLGHGSHGARMVSLYVDRLRGGHVDGKAKPRRLEGDGPLVRIDGNRAFGQTVGAFAVEHGVAAARRHGIAATLVTRSSHLGRNGKWAELAAAQGVASLHFINAPFGSAVVAPHGAREARLGSCPIAFGAPYPDGDPIVVDFATSDVSINTIALAAEKGERLANACLIAKDGGLSDDPAEFLGEGAPRAVLSFGGYKGFAIGMFAEIFAGTLTGGGNRVGKGEAGTPNNMLSIYLDVGAMTDRAGYDARIRELSAWVGSAAPRRPGDRVTIPGRRGRAIQARMARSGIPVDRALAKVLAHAADKAGARTELAARWPVLFTTR